MLDIENVYEHFKEWFITNFRYKVQTKYPVTVNDIIDAYPRKEECSEQVLEAILTEINGSDPVFKRLYKGGFICVCYENIEKR